VPHRRCGMMIGKHGSADSWFLILKAHASV
jgi:hypothetical protein